MANQTGFDQWTPATTWLIRRVEREAWVNYLRAESHRLVMAATADEKYQFFMPLIARIQEGDGAWRKPFMLDQASVKQVNFHHVHQYLKTQRPLRLVIRERQVEEVPYGYVPRYSYFQTVLTNGADCRQVQHWRTYIIAWAKNAVFIQGHAYAHNNNFHDRIEGFQDALHTLCQGLYQSIDAFEELRTEDIRPMVKHLQKHFPGMVKQFNMHFCETPLLSDDHLVRAISELRRDFPYCFAEVPELTQEQRQFLEDVYFGRLYHHVSTRNYPIYSGRLIEEALTAGWVSEVEMPSEYDQRVYLELTERGKEVRTGMKG